MDPRDVLKLAAGAAPRNPSTRRTIGCEGDSPTEGQGIDWEEGDADLPMAPTCWVLQDSLRELAEARRMRGRVSRVSAELRYQPRSRGSRRAAGQG